MASSSLHNDFLDRLKARLSGSPNNTHGSGDSVGTTRQSEINPGEGSAAASLADNESREVTLGPLHVAVGEPIEGRAEATWTEHGPAFGKLNPITRTMLGLLHDWPEIGLRHLALALTAELDDGGTPRERAEALAVLREFRADHPDGTRNMYEPWRVAKTEADGVARPKLDRMLRTIDPEGRKWGVALAAAGARIDGAPASSWRVGRLGPFLDDGQRELVLRQFAKDTPGQWLQIPDYLLWAKRNPTLPGHPEIRVPDSVIPFGPWAAALEGIDEGDRVSPWADRTRADRPSRRSPSRARTLGRGPTSPWTKPDVRTGMLEVCAEVQRRGLPLHQTNYSAVAAEMNARDCESSETRYPALGMVLRFIARPFAVALTEVGLGAGGSGGGGRVPRAHHHEPDDDRLAADAMQIFEIGGARLSVNRYVGIRIDLLEAAAAKKKIITIPGEGQLTLRFGRCSQTGSRSWPRARDHLMRWAAQRGIAIPGLQSAHDDHKERVA